MAKLEDWDVQDDLLLREAVEQGASLAALAAGAVRGCALQLYRTPWLTLCFAAQVRFSRQFTEEEVTDRWRALLFDKKLGKLAAVRMGKAERAPRPPPPIGDDMPTIIAAWRSARAAAAGAAQVPPSDEPPTFSEVRIPAPRSTRTGSAPDLRGAGGGGAACAGPAQPAAGPVVEPSQQRR